MNGRQKARIEEAIEILKAVDMPDAQLNDRSALCLLALANLGADDKWNSAGNPLIGITPMMQFAERKYGKIYAPNSRETFRRFTIHQFVQAGLALYNPDKPNRPVNSPKAVYQVTPHALELIKTFQSGGWDIALKKFLSSNESLAQKYAAKRYLVQIPVAMKTGEKINLSPGEHSQLIKEIIEIFAATFVPGGVLAYVGDTGEKWGYFDEALFKKLGLNVDHHGKMPDVAFYYTEKNWLILVESVTSHGPMDAKRHEELAAMFNKCKAGIVYVTAFPSKTVMTRFLGAIAWETEVWVADAPGHLIHFNGTRFLGPYSKK